MKHAAILQNCENMQHVDHSISFLRIAICDKLLQKIPHASIIPAIAIYKTVIFMRFPPVWAVCR